jgi:hypothetical protein
MALASVDLERDPAVAEYRQGCVDRIAFWLRNPGMSATVVKVASYDRGGGAAPQPDARYNRVVEQADVARAMVLLPPLLREAARASRCFSRETAGWFRRADDWLHRHADPEWTEWCLQTDEESGGRGRPFDDLLSLAAELMADSLGETWWVPG